MDKTKMNELIELLPETFELVKPQLAEDYERWGDTWKHRTLDGQEDRIFDDFKRYYDQWKYGGKPVPWTKIIGLAHIALVRENHPELLEK